MTTINYNTKTLSRDESFLMLNHFEDCIGILTDNYTKNINVYKEDMKLVQSLRARLLQVFHSYLTPDPGPVRRRANRGYQGGYGTCTAFMGVPQLLRNKMDNISIKLKL